jgi:cyclic beta-1,2-glucan synthetase
MASLDQQLVDPVAGLIRLLTPPFQHAVPSAGYIQAYPPGVRENGGQYSHAGVWAVIAQTRLGDGDAAYRYFTYLSPAHRAAHADRGVAYEIEPYVMAGDVYSEPPYVGRGGWSWYTGSAAWMHRAAIEHLFGMRQAGAQVSFTPCLPSHWPQAELTLRRDGRVLKVLFRRDAKTGGAAPDVAGAERILSRGEQLDWESLAGETRCVMNLQGGPTPATPVHGVVEVLRSA